MRELDGILTFPSSHHAVRAELVLQVHNLPCRTVPCPREISSACGVALRFPLIDREGVTRLLAAARVEVESMQPYPESAGMPTGWIALLKRKQERRDLKG